MDEVVFLSVLSAALNFNRDASNLSLWEYQFGTLAYACAITRKEWKAQKDNALKKHADEMED